MPVVFTAGYYFKNILKKHLKSIIIYVIIPLVLGGIAQLGERLNGIQEVSGSIPLISTTKV